MASKSLEFRPFPWALKHPHIAGPWTSFPARSWRSVARVRYKSWVPVDPRSMHKPCMPACVAFPSSRFVQFTTLYNFIQLPNWWTIPTFPLMPPRVDPFDEYDICLVLAYFGPLTNWMEYCSFYKRYEAYLKPKHGFNCEHQVSSKQFKVQWQNELRVWLDIFQRIQLSSQWWVVFLCSQDCKITPDAFKLGPFAMCTRSVNVLFLKLFPNFFKNIPAKDPKQCKNKMKWSEINSRHALVKHYACGNFSCQRKSSWETSELQSFSATKSHHITHISHHISPHHITSHHITHIAHHSHLKSHITHISHHSSHLTTSLNSHITYDSHHSHLTSLTSHITSHITSHHITDISHHTSLTPHITDISHHISPRHTTSLTSHITSHRITHISHHSYLTCHITDISHYHHISPHHGHHTSLITHISHVTSLTSHTIIPSHHITDITHHSHRISPQKYENYHEKWTSKKLKSRKLRELPRKTRTRPPRAPRKYENYHATAATPKVRELPRILSATSDLNPAFYYRKNPQVLTTLFGEKLHIISIHLFRSIPSAKLQPALCPAVQGPGGENAHVGARVDNQRLLGFVKCTGHQVPQVAMGTKVVSIAKDPDPSVARLNFGRILPSNRNFNGLQRFVAVPLKNLMLDKLLLLWNSAMPCKQPVPLLLTVNSMLVGTSTI